MRPEPNLRIEHLRRTHPSLGDSEGNWGYFVVGPLRIISSGTPDPRDAHQWEHVSVSCADRCPTWDEMCQVKELFWHDDETVLQFHPRKADYVDQHPFTLHLWRQMGVNAVLPPRVLIA